MCWRMVYPFPYLEVNLLNSTGYNVGTKQRTYQFSRICLLEVYSLV
jgi:hypothetical protein